jgi:hypothetical protein
MASTTFRGLRRSVLYAGLIGWGAISAARQIHPDPGYLVARLDPLGVYIPNYRFFAPEPAVEDICVIVRDRMADGTLGEWREIDLSRPRRTWHMLVYSIRRIEKGLGDLARHLMRSAAVIRDNDRLSTSLAYTTLLNVATYSVEHDRGAVQVQFAIGTVAAYEPAVEPQIKFVSNFHDLPNSGMGPGGATAGPVPAADPEPALS